MTNKKREEMRQKLKNDIKYLAVIQNSR